MADEDETQREVIAHFSIPLIVFFAGLCVFLVWLCFAVWQAAFFEHPAPYRHGALVVDALVLPPISIFFWVCMVRLVHAAIISRGDALWIESDRLVYADRTILDTPLDDILSADMVKDAVHARGGPFKINSIAFRLKDKKDIKISPAYFVENRDDIISRIRERAGLPPAA